MLPRKSNPALQSDPRISSNIILEHDAAVETVSAAAGNADYYTCHSGQKYTQHNKIFFYFAGA